MSALDQPLLIANSNYHVGHQIAIFVAEVRGFFRDEHFESYRYPTVQAYREASGRAALRPALQTALAAVEKYGH